jgi:hypothetical protein
VVKKGTKVVEKEDSRKKAEKGRRWGDGKEVCSILP